MHTQPAIHGGKPVKTTPFGTGKRFGAEELEQLREALEQQTLFYWHGKKVRGFCEKLAGIYGMPYCAAASSGTAAIHTALGALGIAAGDEVITTPITDMGTLIGILYQNAVPVFADLDPHTYNPDPKSIEDCITEKTKAIVVVHLAGNPADMDAVMDIAARHNLKVIEDCAQSWLASYKGKWVGTIGDIGCFSTNEFKHISTGDGGALLTRDELLYRKALMFADKNYDRIGGMPIRNCEALAPNYRMT
ncbi:MAG: DegT/DnrJ/EryC1/StrS family aminotransferase, partial [Firmicutes bacterium]|nr:DegT/DnrJ/EryC1/StrS family aminotransferase [Bacillota bacterium]